jgi:hypothetical protein
MNVLAQWFIFSAVMIWCSEQRSQEFKTDLMAKLDTWFADHIFHVHIYSLYGNIGLIMANEPIAARKFSRELRMCLSRQYCDNNVLYSVDSTENTRRYSSILEWNQCEACHPRSRLTIVRTFKKAYPRLHRSSQHPTTYFNMLRRLLYTGLLVLQ